MHKRSKADPTRAEALEPYDGAEAVYEHARWMYERDEQRASDAVTRALGIMAVASALLAVLPLAVDQVGQGRGRDWFLIPFGLGALLLLASIVAGGLACTPRKDASPSLSMLEEAWQPWRTGPGAAAAILYRDFAGTILDSDGGEAPLVAMRRLADHRMDCLSWATGMFMLAAVTLTATEIIVLYGVSR